MVLAAPALVCLELVFLDTRESVPRAAAAAAAQVLVDLSKRAALLVALVRLSHISQITQQI
jgi:hypothetical protein